MSKVLRICPVCNTMYTQGEYAAHADGNPLHPNPYHPQPGIRTCTICGKEYPAGKYRLHIAATPHAESRFQSRLRKRDEAIIAALDADPWLTLEAAAEPYGITRERVRQIYVRKTGKSADRRPRKPTTKPCPACGREYTIGKSKEHAAATGHSTSQTQFIRNQEWVALYEDGLSSVQIARAYDTRPSYVLTVLKRNGAKLRGIVKGAVYVRRKNVPKAGDDGR